MSVILENGQSAETAPRVNHEDLKRVERRAREQRAWLRELKGDIREISANLDDNRFSYYDLMFMKRSFKTCWTLYRAIMSDKAELQAAYNNQQVRKAA